MTLGVYFTLTINTKVTQSHLLFCIVKISKRFGHFGDPLQCLKMRIILKYNILHRCIINIKYNLLSK